MSVPGRGRALVAAFLLTFAGAAAVSFAAGFPRPQVHDEFSYLLAADTYARGRLANPPHPAWRHFEAPHVLQRPTYGSKYPPAQGAFLAIGQVAFGHPIAGVWLTAALMVTAVTWMLQAWLPARWALLGGGLTALQFGVAGAWAQSYWGGAVAATGGALLFGALGRVWRAGAGRPGSWRPAAAALGTGAVLLALSRPFEGLVMFLVVVASLLAGGGRGGRVGVKVALVGASGAAVVAGTVMALHNRAVTGDPLTLPYQLHARQYAAAPLFVFQPLPDPPSYSNPQLAGFHLQWEREQYLEQSTLGGWAYHALAKPLTAAKDLAFGPPRNIVDRPPLLGFWIPGAMLLPLLAAPWLLRRRKPRYAFQVVTILFVALSAATYFVPHYVAVLTPVWMYLVVESLRLCRAAAPSAALRSAVVPLAVALSTVLVGQSALDQAIRLQNPAAWDAVKERLHEHFDSVGGRHLVLVRYAKGYSYHRELVYNGADIDGQEVVWAHSLSPQEDAALLRYFADRKPWTLFVTREGVQLGQLPWGESQQR